MKYVLDKSVSSSQLLSQGIVAGQFLFTSGQIGMNKITGKLENNTFEDEVIQALENIKSILESEALSLDDVIKITIFITDINYFDSLNKVYLKYFPSHKPARTCVTVSSLAMGARVEIEAVAFNNKE